MGKSAGNGTTANTPPNVRVAVADDSATFRDAARAVIEGCPGFRLVAEACSGEEAIEVAGRTALDLILLDVRMPGAGGVAAARTIMAQHPEILVILVSTGLRDDTPGASLAPVRYMCKSELCPRTLMAARLAS